MYKKKYSKKKKSQRVKSHSRNKIRRGNRKLKNSHRKSRKNMKGGSNGILDKYKDIELHHYGLNEIESNENDHQRGTFTIEPRNYSVKYPNGHTAFYNSPSDEFINDYIPHDLDIPVTWRDVLTMGMIHEQKTTDQTNLKLRPDIQYNKIKIKYPYPLEEEV